MSTFSSNLKAARKMRGLSLQELADTVGNISKQALQKYETGQMEPSEDVLLRLAASLQLPVDFFYRQTTLSLENIEFRKLASMGKKKQDALRESTFDFVRRYLELEELIGETSEVDWKNLLKFRVTGPDDVEDAAEKVRKTWDLGLDPIYNAVGLLEDHQVKVFELEEDPSFSGSCTWADKKVPVIVINAHPEITIERKRFTAFHELGHLLLTFQDITEKEKETFCHQFAGAMLLPRETLYKELGSHKRERLYFNELVPVKEQYGISIAAILFRMVVNGIISKSYHKWLMINYNRYNYRHNEPGSYKGEERSGRFRQLLMRGISMELISTSKAASLNNQKLADFRKFLV